MNSVQSIAISKIRVVNPRARSKKRFAGFVENVSKVGLKKPITVRPRSDVPGEFDLVCGQGRMEAYLANGQTEVPALVLDISEEDGYLMSLVENIARRKPCTLDLAERIVRLEQLGHSSAEIARKIGVSDNYTRQLLRLHQNGEERLLAAVERGDIPIAVAAEIASSDDQDVQRCLAEAYEKGLLRGKALNEGEKLGGAQTNARQEVRTPRCGCEGQKTSFGRLARSRLPTRDAAAGVTRQESSHLRAAASVLDVLAPVAARGGGIRQLAASRGARQDAGTGSGERCASRRVVTKQIETGFLLEPLDIALNKLLPSARLADGVKASPRYETIVASVREVGIIEPLIVYPERGAKGLYVVLDGHLRLEILKDLGRASVMCLVAKDDESYTYNTHVSRVAPIQEVGMIRKAIAAGVSEERIAKALNLSTQTIRRNARRLKGICPEAVEILKDKPISEVALSILRKVKPYRQIEMADLMARTGHYTSAYARTLLLRTPKDQYVAGAKRELRPEDIRRLEAESRSSEKEFALATESHGKNVMDLMLLRTYIKKLLDNARVIKFMAQRKPDLLRELQQVIEATSLEA